MSIADLRSKSPSDLQTELATTRAALAEAHRLRAMNELTNTSTIRKYRRSIAQILSVLGEKAAEKEQEGKEA